MTKLKGLRWWIIGLVALATVINYVDRSSLAIMWPDIGEDLNMTKSDYSTIAIMFTLAYAVSQSLSGRLYDWVGTRAGFIISIVVWSASAALHSVARTVLSFSLFRFFLGLGEAGNWPGATKSNAEWFPIKERAFAQGIFNSGASIGSIISPPLIAFLYLWVGWKITFILLGVLGLLWIIPWLFINRAMPKDHPWLSDQERDYIINGQKPEGDEESDDDYVPALGQLLKQKETWAVLASRFFLDPIWWLFVYWLPIYLADSFGFDVKQIGLSAWVPYVGAALGALFGGWFAGKLMNKGWSADKARKWSIVLGGIVMLPSLLLTAFAGNPIYAIILIALILFGFQTAIGNIQTLPSDFFTGKAVGTVAGLGGTTAALGVIITTYSVPLITKISYIPFFILGAALVPIGIACIYLFGGRIHRIKLENRTFKTEG